MATENRSRVSSLNEIKGEIVDTELDTISGGDKATTTKATTPYLEITLEQVLIS